MKELIDKAAVVGEIEEERDRIRKGIISIPLTGSDRAYATFEYEILGKVRDFINTLGVKEVDEQKERMSECPYRQVGCKMYEGKILECNGACDWVVDHLNFKELLKQRKENKHGSTRENLYSC